MTDAATLRLDDDNPWPGLAAYTEATRGYFCGREQDSAELIRLIRLAPFVTLYGKSGLGKSSMLQAGVFPELRKAHFLPVYLRLDYTEKAEPVLHQALARMLQEAADTGMDAAPPEPNESLWAYLQRRERPLWTPDNYPLTPLLVFDQFEEVFSRGGSPQQIKRVLDCIADLVGDRLSSELAEDRDRARSLNLQSQQYRVVLSFRSDFLADVESWEKAASLPKREALHLKAMTRATAIDAVQRAGAAVLEPGVATRIVDFVLDRDDGPARHGSEVEPVLLSLCCYQLNKRRNRPAKIDNALLDQAGHDILRDFYDEALQGMPARVSEFIEENLIQGGHYRNSYPRDDAVSSGLLTIGELDRLVAHRLLRVDPQGDVPRIELIHDRVVSVVREAREARHAQLHAETERRKATEIGERQQREAALQHAQHERQLMAQGRNRLRWAAMLLVLLALGLLGLWNRASTANAEYRAAARESASLSLVLHAQAVLDGNREGGEELAFQQLLAAYQLLPMPKTDGPMLDALTSHEHLRSLKPTSFPTESDALAIAFSADTGQLVAGHRSGSVSVRGVDPATDAQVVQDRAAPILDLALYQDQLVTASADGSLRRWTLPSQNAPLKTIDPPMTGHKGMVYSVAYNHDGSRIASAGEDGTVRLWDARSGAELKAQHPAGGAALMGVAFSPDGTTLAVVTVKRKDNGKSLVLLDPVSLEPQRHELVAGTSTAYALAYSRRRLLATSGDNVVRVRDLNNQSVVRMEGRIEGAIQTVAFSPNERWVAAGGVDGIVRLWQARNGYRMSLPMPEDAGPVTSVAFSADGRKLAAAVRNQLLVWELNIPWAPAHPSNSKERLSAALARNGLMVVFGLESGDLLVLENGRSERYLRRPAVEGPTAAPCGKAQASTKFVDASQPSNGTRKTKCPDAALAVAVSPDGAVAWSGHGDGGLQRWDLIQGKALGPPIQLGNYPVEALAVSRNGRHVAVVDTGRQMVYRLNDQGLAGAPYDAQLDAKTTVTALALSADGSRLAVGTDAPRVQLFQPDKPGSQKLADTPTSLAFGHDDGTLVVGTQGGKVLVWTDRKPLQPLSSPPATHNGPVQSVAFGDEKFFYSTDATGPVHRWPARSQWKGLMCSKAGSSISRAAWTDKVPPMFPYQCACPGRPIAADDPKMPAAKLEQCPRGS